MEDKYKNLEVISLDKFMLILEEELNKKTECKEVVLKIVSKLKEITLNENLEKIAIKKDKNITSNSIYFLSFDFKRYEIVLKIRKEMSPIEYSEELKYLNKLEKLSLIPKQFFNVAVDNFKIILEEFINCDHVPDEEVFNKGIVDTLIDNTAKFNQVEVLEYSKDEIQDVDSFYLNYLLSKYLPYSKAKFQEIYNSFSKASDSQAKEYFNCNNEVFVKIIKFLNEIPNYYNKIMNKLFSKCYKIKLVFSYIDTHNWNFFISNNIIKFIDFEDLSFCIPGFDLANYIIESTYTFSDEAYPFYINDVNKFDEDFLKICFEKYSTKMENKLTTNFTLKDIYSLFCLSIIKAVIEYVFMVDDFIFKKESIDFILLMGDRISVFEYYYYLNKQ